VHKKKERKIANAPEIWGTRKTPLHHERVAGAVGGWQLAVGKWLKN
jgi:hypothetical protein